MNGRSMSWIVAVGLVLAAGVAAAQPFDVPPGRWWERPFVAGRLALSPDQVKQLDSTTYAFARRMVDLKGAVEKAQIDLRATAEAEPFAPEKVREAFAVLQQARTRLEMERFDMLLKVREVLTPDQWSKLQELARARRAEKGNGAQPAPGNGQRGNQPPRRWR
jgi:Spy/CpxP family protein refolding chaperone